MRGGKCADSRQSMFLPVTPAAALIPVYLWLANARICEGGVPSLVLEHLGADFSPLAENIASHLAQYQDMGEVGWLCLDEATVDLARKDVAMLALLGLDAGKLVPLADFLPELLKHGGIIIERRLSPRVNFSASGSFRVAIVPAGKFQPPGFHLAADPLKFTPSCLVSVIGDTFLEWLNNRTANPTPEDTHAA